MIEENDKDDFGKRKDRKITSNCTYFLTKSN